MQNSDIKWQFQKMKCILESELKCTYCGNTKHLRFLFDASGKQIALCPSCEKQHTKSENLS